MEEIPYGANDDFSCALDLSKCLPEEKKWYERLSARLGCTFVEAVLHHVVMYHAKHMGHTTEQRAKYFPRVSRKDRGLLLGILEKVVAGENLPDF